MTNKETTFSWDLDEVSPFRTSGAVNICQQMTRFDGYVWYIMEKGDIVKII